MDEVNLSKKAIYQAFPGIPDSEADKLIRAGKVMVYPPETKLCLEGKIEDIFYVILTGNVVVTKQINNTDNRLLKELKPGDFFGEMGLIHDAPRAATVTTLGETTVLEIDKLGFNDVLHQSSTVSLAMVREVSRRLRENDEMAIEDLRLKAGELAEAYQQLAELDLARREFLTTIAHELRTPLTSANGYLQMIQMGFLQGEDLKKALDTVTNNLQRIVGLTNDILFLQEMDLIFSEFELIDVNSMMNEIVKKELDHAIQMGVQIEFVENVSLPKVFGDKKSLERTFLALVNNSIKFSLNGGEVNIYILEDDQYIWVHIRDQGIGIPEENLTNIFERFWRTEEYEGHLFDGVGLGLSIAKQVIEQHNGLIKVQSQGGKGALFKVGLPKTISELG
ncbi:MAG: ATP-binding protein [Anaerolineales bacterium]|jgi:signal transduction histidine kinase